MKKTSKILLTLFCVLVLLSPVILTLTVALALPAQYTHTYVGALPAKIRTLADTKGEKVVLVGGSATAFGTDSALLEKYVGRPVVNFGLYAALGTKLMMELSRPYIGKGDIVILSPELDAQTLSLYFNAEQTLMALDGHFSYARYLEADDILALLGGMWKFSSDKLSYLSAGNAPDPQGVYNARNFDARGDLTYPRPENIMRDYYDPNKRLSFDLCALDGEFVAYVNEYTRYCSARGATVFFSFCPLNARAVCEDADPDAFEAECRRRLACPLVNTLSDVLMEAGYFYDSNFHLNDTGRRAYTIRLTEKLLFALNDPSFVEETVPPAPALPKEDTRWFGTDENEKYFTFRQEENGYMTISGLSELGKTQTTLTVPYGSGTYKVATLGTGALAGGVVEKLVIPRDSNLTLLANDCFLGAGNLHDLWIYKTDPATIGPPVSFAGVPSDFRVHIPAGSDYGADYFWSNVRVIYVEDANGNP